jgi:PAS domain S-box-containing protein
VREWTFKDVAAFLQSMPEFEALAGAFAAEMITGEDLIVLNDTDLRELGVVKLGHRKRLLKRARMLRDGATADETVPCESDVSTSTMHLATIVATYKQERFELEVKESDSFAEVLRRLCQLFRLKAVQVHCEEGDGGQLRLIRNDVDFFQVVQDAPPDKPLFLICSNPGPDRSKEPRTKSQMLPSVANAEFAMLEALPDPTVVINDDCIVLVFNAAAERMFGYRRGQVIGSNVSMLMPDTYAAKHDGFVANYLATGFKRIIGKTRTVMARAATGNMFPIELSVTETSVESGVRFIGTLRPATTTVDQALVSLPAEVQRQASALTTMQEAGIITDVSGVVLFVNTAACALTGYATDELVGHSVTMCMPSPHRENHEYYMQRYVQSGVRRVIGTSRDVIMETKGGDLTSVNLSLSDLTADDNMYFVGLMSRTDGGPRSLRATPGSSSRGGADVNLARQMISSVNVPAIVINSQGLIQGFNVAAQKLFGYQLIEILGRNVSMLVDVEHADQHDEYLQAYLETGVAKLIGKERLMCARTKAGKTKKVKLNVTEVKGETSHLFIGMLHPLKPSKSSKRRTRTSKKSPKPSI